MFRYVPEAIDNIRCSILIQDVEKENFVENRTKLRIDKVLHSILEVLSS